MVIRIRHRVAIPRKVILRNKGTRLKVIRHNNSNSIRQGLYSHLPNINNDLLTERVSSKDASPHSAAVVFWTIAAATQLSSLIN
jgi:hypothetical protein